MAHVLQRPLNTRVAPVWIFCCHPNHKTPNLGEHRRSSWAPTGVGPFPLQSARDAIEEWCPTSRALPRRAIRPVRAAGRGRPDADVAHRLIAVGDCPIALVVRDSLREETRSHRVARARAIHTAPRAASVTEPRRESTRMRRSSFRTFRGHSHSVACGLPTRRRHHRVHLYSNAQTRVSDCRMLSASVIASPIWRL